MFRSAAALFLASALPAAAATITVQVRDEATTAGLPGMEVRAWSCAATDENGCKTWTIFAYGTDNGGGSYSISVSPGTYLVDARPGAGVTTQYTDRWYDVAAPQSSPPGFDGSMADRIAV